MELASSRFGRLPLRALAVFEAAARHGKFATAAHELGMSAAAVSQHVSQLEAELGTELFHRRHRGVVPTPAGEQLLQAAQQGLQMLADGVAVARRQSDRHTVRILTDFGFAAWWLMPRIAALADQMPDIEIRLITTQGNTSSLDDDADLAVLFGAGHWSGGEARLLFAEEICPVCAPALVAGLDLPLAPAGIAGMRRLHLRSSGPQRWFDWDDWFGAMGLNVPARPQDLTFNNYQIVLQAALLGQGVALGWSPLSDALIADGSLVRLSDATLASPRGYHLVEPIGIARKPAAARVAHWLWTQRRETASG